jgi:hypothetical protein
MTTSFDRGTSHAVRARRAAPKWAALLGMALSFPLVSAQASAARAAVHVTAATVYPSVPPPEAVPEDRPVAPGPKYYWVPGYWNWTGSDWQWVSGYWTPTRAGYVYVAPRVVSENGRWVYYRAYYKGPKGHREYGYIVQPRAEWRGRPRVDPVAFRAQHGQARQIAVDRAAAQHHLAEHREAERIAAARKAAEHHALEHREAERIEAKHRAAVDREAERKEAARIAAERRAASLHEAQHRASEHRGVQSSTK